MVIQWCLRIYLHTHVYIYIYIQTHNIVSRVCSFHFCLFVYLPVSDFVNLGLWLGVVAVGCFPWAAHGFLNFGSVQRLGLVGVWDAGVEDFGAFGFGFGA